MGWLQPYWPSWEIDEARTVKLIEVLAADSRVGKILLEPHLKDRLKLDHPKIRFQGCRAARHDDHIHMQLQ
jgi:murein endopeptidase